MKTTSRVLCGVAVVCALLNAAGAALNDSVILAGSAVLWTITAVLYALAGR